MRFFTRAWASGELDDVQLEATPAAYQAHIASLRLPPSVSTLSQVNPHDAYVLGISYQQDDSRLLVRLRCGDLQLGYSDVVLIFSGVNIAPSDLATLRRALRPAQVEVLYDEVDRVDAHFEYRLLLWPYQEVAIGFKDVEVTQSPVASRDST